MSRPVAAIAALFLLSSAQSGPRAQTPAAVERCDRPCLSIVSVGGFLGYIDGFPEHPGWASDTFSSGLVNASPRLISEGPVPFGGVLGVSQWLRGHDRESTLVLVPGNNHPQRITPQDATWSGPADFDWFWNRLAELGPAAVAIGGEDIHRLLSQMPAIRVVDWIQSGVGSRRLPLVASNLMVRLTGSGVNDVHDAASGIALEIDADESLGMITSLRAGHSCDITIPSARFAGGEPAATPTVEPSTPEAREETGCHTTIALARPLRPGRTYALHLSVTRSGSGPASPSARFQLRTHEVVTAHPATDVAWDGLPVVRTERSGLPLAVMAFVSESVMDEVAAVERTWQRHAGCPVATCELAVLDPVKAAQWWLSLGSESAVPPILLALSDLSGEENDAVLDSLPQLRFLSVMPESLRLGRASPQRHPEAGRRFSGDLSFGAIVDGAAPELTRFIVRPEWIGEVAIVTRARVTGRGTDDAPWSFMAPLLQQHSIRGAELVPEVVASENRVAYRASLDGENVAAAGATFRAYCPLDPAGPFDSSGEPQSDLWTLPGSMMALVLDEMRRTMSADVAILPRFWVDPEVTEWLLAERKQPRPEGKPIGWLSGFVLERVMYRAEPLVRIALPDDAVGKTLAAIVEDAAGAGGVCASGLGLPDACPIGEIDVADLLLNVRRPQPGHFYSVALPESLAREHKLDFESAQRRQILGPLDTRLAEACAAPPHSATAASRTATGRRAEPRSLARRLEDRLSGRIQQYVRFDPLSFEYSYTSVKEPPDGRGLFGKLPTDGSSAKDNRQVVVDAAVDIGLLDSRRFIVKVPATVAFNRKDLDDATSFDENRFSVALLGGYKRLFSRRATVFAGAAIEGEIADTWESVTAQRELGAFPDPANGTETLTGVTVKGPTLKFRRRRGFFTHGTLGVELPKYEWNTTTVSRLTVSIDAGRSTNVPDGIVVGTERFPLERFIRDGAAGVLRSAYTSAPGTIDASTPFGFSYRHVSQWRTEVDGRTETTFGRSKIATSTRVRWYNQIGDEPALATRWSVLETVSWEWPIWKRWSVAPYGELNVVGVTDLGPFSLTKVGVKAKLATFFKRGHGTVLE